jgi:hypothetical protein
VSGFELSTTHLQCFKNQSYDRCIYNYNTGVVVSYYGIENFRKSILKRFCKLRVCTALALLLTMAKLDPGANPTTFEFTATTPAL